MTPSGADGKNVWSRTSGLTVCLHDRDGYNNPWAPKRIGE